MHRGRRPGAALALGALADLALGIVESLPDPVVVLDREGRFRAANAAFCRAFRLSAQAGGGEPGADSGAVAELGARLREALRGRSHLAGHVIAQVLVGGGGGAAGSCGWTPVLSVVPMGRRVSPS